MNKPKVHQREPDRPLVALLWMMGSALGFSCMALIVKQLAPVIPSFELVFFRSGVNFLLMLGIMLWRGERIFPRGKPLLFARGVCGFLSLSCFFVSISQLPLSLAGMIYWCSPIFVVLFSRVFLKEKTRGASLAWMGGAFIGLGCLLKPETGASFALPWLPVGIGLLGSAFGGLAYVAVRAATARVGGNVIVLYFVGTATFLSLPLAARDFRIPTIGQGLALVALGLSAGFGQFTMTQGYRYAPAGLVSAMGLLTAGLSTLFGWLILHETLTAQQWGGMALMGISITFMTLKAAPRTKVVV